MSNFDLKKYLAEGRLLKENTVNNKYVVKDEELSDSYGDFYRIDTQKALDYLSQFDNEDVDAEAFINDDEGWGEFEQYLEDVEQMSDEELEDAMRSEMSMYFFSDEDSLNEDVDPTTAEAEAQKLIDVLGVMVEPDPNNYGDQIRLRVYPDSKPDDRFYNSRSAQGFSIAVENGKYLFSSAGGYRRSIEPIAQLFGVEPNYNTGVAGRSNIDMSLKKKPIDLATVKMIVNYTQLRITSKDVGCNSLCMVFKYDHSQIGHTIPAWSRDVPYNVNSRH